MAIKTTAVNDGASTKINYAYWEKYQQQKAAEAAKAAEEAAAANTGKQLGTNKSSTAGVTKYGSTNAAAPAEEEKAETPVKALTGGGSSGGGSVAKESTPAIDMTGITSAYQQAMDVLKAAEKEQPIYDSSYDDQIAEIMGKITGRGKFEYDLSGDALYQQYKDQYMAGAQQAMRDTMGQAAALTGGYGSSYGQMVGQQAYDQQLQQLNNVVPELYGMAYDQYTDEGNRLFDELGMFMDMEQQAYDRYTDDYNKWLTERSYADAKAADALAMQGDKLSQLEYLISLGYTPTAQEIADAGLNLAQYNAIAAQYAPKTSSGGGGSGVGDGAGIDWAATNWNDLQYIAQGLGNSDATDAEKRAVIAVAEKAKGLSDEDAMALMAQAGLYKESYLRK